MRTISTRERRVLAAFVFVLAPLFAVAYGARPLIRFYGDRSSTLHQQREMLERERAIVQHAQSFSVLIDGSRSALEHEARGVIRGSERATAYVALADHIRSIARRNDVLIVQATEMPADSSGDGLTTLRLALRAESDLAGITRLLESVRQDSLRLRVSRILIEPASRSQFGGNAVASDGRHVLVLNATIEALARIGGSSLMAAR